MIASRRRQRSYFARSRLSPLGWLALAALVAIAGQIIVYIAL